MKTQPAITHVICDDWQGIYVDGVLKAENHSLSPHTIFTAIGLEYSTLELDEAQIEMLGGLPATLTELRHSLSPT